MNIDASNSSRCISNGWLQSLLTTSYFNLLLTGSLPYMHISNKLIMLCSVRRRYAWIYATAQFMLVVVFAIVFFYSKVSVSSDEFIVNFDCVVLVLPFNYIICDIYSFMCLGFQHLYLLHVLVLVLLCAELFLSIHS